MSIRTRASLILAAVAVVSAGETSLVGYRIARQAIEELAFKKLTAVREMKGNQVEDYLSQIRHQILTLAESPMVVEATRDFRAAHRSIEGELSLPPGELQIRDQRLRQYYQDEFLTRLAEGSPASTTSAEYWPQAPRTRLLQQLYISDSPLPTGSKHLLDAAEDASSYSAAHLRYHPLLRNFLERFGYYDLFLIDHETGEILYTVFKEVDFGTSLVAGAFRDSNLAEVFREARDSQSPGFVKLVDFEPYLPSYGARASFIATPIHDAGEIVGVLAFQMPVDRLNDIMTSREEWERVGLGETGETYIVGDDLTLRNQSRFLIEEPEAYLRAIGEAGVPAWTVRQIETLGSSIGLQRVETEGTLAALRGEAGNRVFPDYRGVPVLSSFRALEVPDVQWVIMSEIDRAEALAPVRALRNRILVALALLVLVMLTIAFWFATKLTRRIERLATVAGDLAEGHLDQPVQITGSDEITDLARSFEAMRRSLQSLVEKQEREIEALSVPLIPLGDGVVALPLVGELDSKRLFRMREALVEGLHAAQAEVALLDLTGVPRLDHEGAEALARAAKAARLLGVRVVLTGMQAEVAKGLADLDLDLEGIEMERTLRSGVEAALQESPEDTSSSRAIEQEQEA